MSQKEAGFQCRVASKQGTQAATKRKTIAKSSVFPDILRLNDTVSLMSFFFYNIRKTCRADGIGVIGGVLFCTPQYLAYTLTLSELRGGGK